MRIGVVGSGAIGTYYGAKLVAAGSDVHFLVRSGFEEIRKRGFHVSSPGEEIRLEQVNCYRTTAEIGRCDLALIAVKTTANGVLADLVRPLVDERTLLLTLQNGLGNEEVLAPQFGTGRILAGLCFICVHRISPGVVQKYDYGHINLGEYERKPEQRTYDIAAVFQRAGIDCTVVENLALERWRKLVWNIPFNGLSILAGGIDTGAILADRHLRGSAFGLMHEVIGAANKLGFRLEMSVADEQISLTEKIKPYKPSTLLDFEAARALEIEAIWGEPLRRAIAAGAEVPRLRLLYSTLRSLERVQQSKQTRS